MVENTFMIARIDAFAKILHIHFNVTVTDTTGSDDNPAVLMRITNCITQQIRQYPGDFSLSTNSLFILSSGYSTSI